MAGSNVTIKQDVKKRIRTFIAPNGELIDGGAEAYFGNQVGNKLERNRPSNFGGKGSEDK